MKNSFSVKTILRKDLCKKDEPNKHPLHYQIIFRGGKTKTTSGKYVHITQWDEKKKCVKDSLLKSVLVKEELRIYKLLLEMENNGEVLNGNSILRKIKGEDKLNPDFYFHFDEFIKNKFAVEDLAEKTKGQYLLLRRRLKSFKPNITLNEINYKLIDDFVYYLKVDLNVGKSGINSRIKNLNCVLRKLVIQKKISENPCIYFKKFEENPSVDYLNTNELKRLISADLKLGSLNKGLEHTRNLFLFSCYTGLRDCDIKNLKKRDIGENKKIIIRQIKTKSIVEIPYNEYWYKILMENNFDQKKDNELVLAFKSNAVINRQLKVIAKIAKIKKNLHFHMGRHTFGSTLAKGGTPINFIAKYMGHKSIKTTQIYMNTDSSTLDEVMKKIIF